MVKTEGIITKVQDRDVAFQFITKPQTKEINEMKDRLIFKEKLINYMQNDLKILNISSQLKSPKVKISIEQLTNRILHEICSDE